MTVSVSGNLWRSMVAVPELFIILLGRNLQHIYLPWKWVSSLKKSKRRNFSSSSLVVQWDVRALILALKLWKFSVSEIIFIKGGKTDFGPQYFCSQNPSLDSSCFMPKMNLDIFIERESLWEFEFCPLFYCKSNMFLYFSIFLSFKFWNTVLWN